MVSVLLEGMRLQTVVIMTEEDCLISCLLHVLFTTLADFHQQHNSIFKKTVTMTRTTETPAQVTGMSTTSSGNSIPRLVQNAWSKQLHVKGEPFLMRAGELQNSSLTCPEYMDTVWQKMVDTNYNTLLGCVTWEMIEPEEGMFDFTVLDKVIQGARQHNLHLVLLWFGSFKNG